MWRWRCRYWPYPTILQYDWDDSNFDSKAKKTILLEFQDGIKRYNVLVYKQKRPVTDHHGSINLKIYFPIHSDDDGKKLLASVVLLVEY